MFKKNNNQQLMNLKINKIIIVLVLILAPSLRTIAQVPFLEGRDVIKINDWKFFKGVNNKGQLPQLNDLQWESVKIPHSYSMDAIHNVGYYKGETWYRTKVEVPTSMKGKRVYLRFEGVGQEAVVYLNGKKIGKHTGGYSAFCFEITDKIDLKKENILAVNVSNAPNFKRIPVDDALFNHYGGIYRSVQIFSTPICNITPTYFASSGVFVETTKLTDNNAELEIRTHISNPSNSEKLKISYLLKNAKNKVVAESEKEYIATDANFVAVENLTLQDPILWNGRINPHQYNLEVKLTTTEGVDRVSQKFGIKTYEIDPEKGFILNHDFYRLNGVCKHQEWKQVGPAVTENQLRTDMDLIDEIGAASLRLSHYQHSDLTYQLADEKGILVWAEIPNVHDWSGREEGNAKQQLKELIYQNYNHPSVFVWGLWNEVRAWEGKNSPPVKLVKELKKIANSIDKTRLTISASDRDMISNMGNITDLQAWNKYFGWYSNSTEELGVWLDKSHKNHPNIKIAISEYGAGGNINHQDISKLEKPKGKYFPEMVASIYHEKSWKILKDRPFVWGTFVWNMFDFSVAGWNRGGVNNLNHKGLVTYDRKVKKDAFYFYKANWSKSPVLYITEKRNKERSLKVNTVKVYTNLNKVTLYVNNKKIRTLKNKSDINIVIFDNVKLRKGKNVIKVVSNDETSIIEDVTNWNLKE
ncbi:glycoside hydrolase family 2 protein [Wenyingzhuangia sp. 2_MG-2023]|uniref:glycoside hydrolase family 2 protein n=1 Tax=Wenyingzhuangia sp. 2_MG-2023 TaxID=3062639 RepID=UPI0026E1FC8A|nr:glycoside hydrolase family 2 TIM barrel-domain containing protein [Wenyingzhuangia sp. 2_MG-2023]MDO6738722.1 glycoside hydrolase family 2 TIM barrel-domain containing protein [Wenyingzhuangia sp. 2_MG-2023]MDO6803015.1 glycoside hydrolase family 2 TIM barrel-domain containing protein [Wenyingzhuangia sp. 1_MG-2023]